MLVCVTYNNRDVDCRSRFTDTTHNSLGCPTDNLPVSDIWTIGHNIIAILDDWRFNFFSRFSAIFIFICMKAAIWLFFYFFLSFSFFYFFLLFPFLLRSFSHCSSWRAVTESSHSIVIAPLERKKCGTWIINECIIFLYFLLKKKKRLKLTVEDKTTMSKCL